jgi:hypothetical protein
MTYGDDWPPAPEPAPEPAEPRHQPLTIRQKCGMAVVVYALIWAASALVLHARGDAGTRLDFPAAPPGHTTEVTTTLPPHVAR